MIASSVERSSCGGKAVCTTKTVREWDVVLALAATARRAPLTRPGAAAPIHREVWLPE